MRPIKFRGKRVVTGEWCFGSLHTDHDNIAAVMMERIPNDDAPAYLVDPDTVGQYTGYTDYNNNDIYEGDILYCSSADCRHAYREVVFHRGGFCLRDWFSTTPIANHNIKAWEIVGNIYDSPELVDIVNGRKGGQQ